MSVGLPKNAADVEMVMHRKSDVVETLSGEALGQECPSYRDRSFRRCASMEITVALATTVTTPAASIRGLESVRYR